MNKFPQEGMGFTYDFKNTSIVISGNLAISKDLGKVILDEEEFKVRILSGIYLKCLKKNWYLSTQREYSYSIVAEKGGINSLYSEIKSELERVRDHLIEMNQDSLITNYLSKLHNKHN